jgi:hypothetical protein
MTLLKKPEHKLAALLLTFGLVTMLATGSEAKDDDKNVELSNSNFSGEVDGNDHAVHISGSNSVVSIAGSPTTLNVEGSNNEVKVPGGCPHISVTGSNNKVVVGLAKKISLVGSNNIAYWAKTSSGKPPEVSNVGSNNRIARHALQVNNPVSEVETNRTSSSSASSQSSVEVGANGTRSSSSMEVGANGIHIKTTDGSNLEMR